MQLTREAIALVASIAAVSGAGGCAQSDDVIVIESEQTATFQTGVDDYVGTLDGEISSRGGPNGSTDMASQTARIMRSAHPKYETAALVKFADVWLPPGALVTSACLTVTFEDDVPGHSPRGYYVRRGWNAASVGWERRDTGMSWNTPGAKGMGTDVMATPAFVDGGWIGTGAVRRTYELDVDVVQKWVDEPSTNRGIVLFDDASSGSLRMYTAESVASENRPLLTIQYTVSDGAAITLAAAAHPRIWMDAAVLQRMRDRATAADERWVALRTVCNSYLPGVVRAPNPVKCQDSCSGSTICCGYQGELYYRALLNLGLCYQVGRRLTPADPSTTAWAQKGAAVLAQMVTFSNYSADHGYGIRNFATGMAIGYDWLFDYLSASEPALTASVVSSLNAWIDWYDAQPASFNFRQHPTSNYFAGYYSAKALTALATEGENPSSESYWTAFLAMQRTSLGTHAGIAPYYTRFLDGGGWVQGWQYGPLAVRNMIEPSLAAITAKGVDLVTDPSAPYRYAVNNGLHLLHFSTPSLTMMDDRDELASFNPADPGACPSQAKTPVSTAVTLTEMLRRWPVVAASGDPVAPRLHSFVRAVRRIYANAPWNDMLFWDDTATETPYTATPDRSYLATNYVSMRSDWSTSATMATMRAIAYSDKDNTHEHPDGGSLLITRGNGGVAGAWQTDVPFLVSPNFLLRCYGTTGISSTWANNLRTDLLTTAGARATLNIFRNTTTSGQSITLYQDAVAPPQSQIRTFEDRGKFVLARAENLDDLYATTSGISEWSRDVVFVRPNLFVVYDRTTSANPSTGIADPHLSWNFAPTPVLATPPSPGAVRYDVADGGVFKGAITTLLPAAASVSGPENVYASNKLFALRVRGPTTTGSIKWLTVFDTATSAGAVALASRIAAVTTNINGALLASTTGNTVVLFGVGAAGAPIAGTIRYTEPAVATALYVTDLAPNATYAVTATVSGLNHTVTIVPATAGFASSPRGTLYLTIAATGAVSVGI